MRKSMVPVFAGLLLVSGIFFILGTATGQAALPRPAAGTAFPAWPPGIAHYWSLDEGSGTTAGDSIGGNDGVILGSPSWQAGVIGQALHFDGTDDQVVITLTASLNNHPPTVQPFPFHGTGDATLMFWVRRQDGIQRTLFWTRGDTTDTNRFHIELKDSGGIGVDYRAPDGTIHGLVGTTVPVNEWVHLALVRSGNTYYLYKNGVLVDQNTDSNPDPPNYVGPWKIGRAATDVWHRYFLGEVDEVMLFSKALSAEQVQVYYWRALYNQSHFVSDDFGKNRLNSKFWVVQPVGQGPGGAVTGQRLEMTVPANASGGAFGAYVNTTCQVEGNFDVSVDYELLTWPTNNGVRLGLRAFSAGGEDYRLERVSRASSESSPGEYYAATLGSTTALTATTDLTGTLRLIREGSTLLAYYRHGQGPWMPVLSNNNLSTGNMSLGLFVWSDDARFAHQAVQVAFDHFVVHEGWLQCVQPPFGQSYWPLDEGSGTVAVDAMGWNHGSVQGGAAWTTGALSQALHFDGVDDQVVISQTFDLGPQGKEPQRFPFHGTGDATLMFWVRRQDGIRRTLFWTRGDTTDANRFHIELNDKGGIGMDYRAPDGTIHGLVGTTVPVNEWVHLALVRSGNTYYLYKNGVLVDQKTDSNPNLPDYVGPWEIGRAATDAWHKYFLGEVDEVMLFSTALSADQVWTYYHNSKNGLNDLGGNDDFNNNRLDPDRWTVQTVGNGPSATVANQRVELAVPASSQGNLVGVFVDSACKVQGDFDISVDYELLTWPMNNGVRLGLRAFPASGGDYRLERASRAAVESPSGEFYQASFGNVITLTATTDLTGTLRLIRQGDTLSAYYRHAEGPWVQVLSRSGLTTGSLGYGFFAWTNDTLFSAQQATVAFDNFTLSRGRLLCARLSPGYGRVIGPAGVTATYTHVLTNTGSYTDTFVITHTNSLNWPVSYTSPVTLGVGQSMTLTVDITPPMGVVSGTVATTVLTVTSQTDPAAWVTLVDTATLHVRYIYLPLILKP